MNVKQDKEWVMTKDGGRRRLQTFPIPHFSKYKSSIISPGSTRKINGFRLLRAGSGSRETLKIGTFTPQESFSIWENAVIGCRSLVPISGLDYSILNL